jgi:hypothetical protein
VDRAAGLGLIVEDAGRGAGDLSREEEGEVAGLDVLGLGLGLGLAAAALVVEAGADERLARLAGGTSSSSSAPAPSACSNSSIGSSSSCSASARSPSTSSSSAVETADFLPFVPFSFPFAGRPRFFGSSSTSASVPDSSFTFSFFDEAFEVRPRFLIVDEGAGVTVDFRRELAAGLGGNVSLWPFSTGSSGPMGWSFQNAAIRHMKQAKSLRRQLSVLALHTRKGTGQGIPRISGQPSRFLRVRKEETRIGGRPKEGGK